MAYAVVESGGKQYVARSGETIDVDRLSLKEGDKVSFDKVLLVADDGSAQVGSPVVEGAMVVGHVIEEFKGPKIIVFKYKPKIRYRKRKGHRQWYTRVAIDDVVAPGQARTSAKATETEGANKADQAPKADKPAEKAKPEPKAKAEAPAKKTPPKATKAKSPTKKAPAARKTASKGKKPSGSSKKSPEKGKDTNAE